MLPLRVRLRIRTDKTQFETMDGVEESDSQQPQQQSVASQPPMQQEQSVACQPPVASQPPMQQEQSIASQPSVQEHSAHEQLGWLEWKLSLSSYTICVYVWLFFHCVTSSVSSFRPGSQYDAGAYVASVASVMHNKT